MKTLRALSLAVFVTTVVVMPSSVGLAAVVDPTLVCLGTKAGGPGAPSINFTLIANSAGSFVQLPNRSTAFGARS